MQSLGVVLVVVHPRAALCLRLGLAQQPWKRAQVKGREVLILWRGIRRQERPLETRWVTMYSNAYCLAR